MSPLHGHKPLGAILAAALVAVALPLAGAVAGSGAGSPAGVHLQPVTHGGGAVPVATTSRLTPVSFGGTTKQDMPIVVQISKNGKRIVQAVSVLEVSNQQSEWMLLPDKYTGIKVKARHFAKSWGPYSQTLDDGSTAILSGSCDGTFAKSGAKVSGTWTYQVVLRDANGTITSTYDSGNVHWTALQ
jgi:hypothetical protein